MLYAIRTKGEPIAVKIKEMFFKDQHWSVVAELVGRKLGDLKKIARKAYPEFDEVKFLHVLSCYSHQDIYDAFNLDAMEAYEK